ncbi:DUF6234 family protein [Streptomyces virginiae]|uniref:DUF6234 family protein n=1 Tax=Streptomyces virginiae TaxID=1961 RepID=UPI0036EDCD67
MCGITLQSRPEAERQTGPAVPSGPAARLGSASVGVRGAAFFEPAGGTRAPGRSRRTPRAADLAIGIPLLSLGAGWLVWDAMSGHGLDIWAAQGDLGRIETADLAHMARIQTFLVVVLVVALLGLVSRAPWTVLSQVLLAILAGVVLTAAQHSWDRSHPDSTGSVSEGAGSRHRENNAFRMPGEMSPASAQDARRDTDRVGRHPRP